MQARKAFSMKAVGSLKTAVLLALCAVQTPAYAVLQNQMQAKAYENLGVSVDNVVPISTSTPVTAAINSAGGAASASARVTELLVAASSLDFQTNHVDGIAVQYSTFTFWNTATDSAYSAGELAGLTLTADFDLNGRVYMPETGPARSTSFTYDTQLYVGVGFDTENGGASLSCGPTGCDAFGSPLLSIGTNTVSRAFSLSNSITANYGMLFSSLSVLGGGGAESAFSLVLTGLRQSGTAILPLGLKFNDNQVLPVRAVPLPGAAAMMLSGIGFLAARRGKA